jgi:hypothetical protein
MTDTCFAGIEESRNLNRRVAEPLNFPLAPKTASQERIGA